MALPQSPLSQACSAIAGMLAVYLKTSSQITRVKVGSPSEAAPKVAEAEHVVNLFFYRFEPSGFGPAANPDEPWRLRLHCLITAFGGEDGVSVSAGENDLRLIGAVLRFFHEQPVLELQEVDVEGDKLRIQVIFQPLGVDEINHIWSTQGEAAYRPSVAYEMALVPVMPEKLSPGSPLVKALGLAVRADEAGRWAPLTGNPAPPAVRRFTVDTGREDWAPRICFVHEDACVESISLAAGLDLASFKSPVWIAGKVPHTVPPPEALDVKVSLSWEIWDKQEGWRPAGGEAVIAEASTETLDPDTLPNPETTVEVKLPPAPFSQAVLFAARTYTRGSDGARLTVRSNPLLVNIYPRAASQ